VAQIPSDKDIPFNRRPAMKAREITDAAIKALRSGKYEQVQTRKKADERALFLKKMEFKYKDLTFC
jgi:Metalloenzyme superfamily